MRFPTQLNRHDVHARFAGQTACKTSFQTHAKRQAARPKMPYAQSARACWWWCTSPRAACDWCSAAHTNKRRHACDAAFRQSEYNILVSGAPAAPTRPTGRQAAASLAAAAAAASQRTINQTINWASSSGRPSSSSALVRRSRDIEKRTHTKISAVWKRSSSRAAAFR